MVCSSAHGEKPPVPQNGRFFSVHRIPLTISGADISEADIAGNYVNDRLLYARFAYYHTRYFMLILPINLIGDLCSFYLPVPVPGYPSGGPPVPAVTRPRLWTGGAGG